MKIKKRKRLFGYSYCYYDKNGFQQNQSHYTLSNFCYGLNFWKNNERQGIRIKIINEES